MFYKYITDITYITESGRKKNKQPQTWVSPKCKKGKVWALFWHSVLLCLSRACTQTKFPCSYQECGLILSHWLTWLLGPLIPTPPSAAASLWPSPFPDCHELFCSGTLPFLIFFQSCRKSRVQTLCVGFTPEQTKESSDWYSPTPTETNAQHRATVSYNLPS